MSKKIVAFFVLLSAFSFIGTSQIKKIAILPIRDVNNEIQTGPKLFIRSSISSAITETPGYEAYDRINLSAIINEQDFQRNGLVSDGEIHKIGEMAGADYVLDAVVAPFDDISVTVDAKITNVETARIENEAVEIISIKDIDKIKIGCTELSKKLLKVIAPSMSVCNHSEKSSSNVVTLADRSIIEKTDDGIALDGFVDLGLSVKWAACNLGALSPEQPGGYYAWGETSIKSVYSKKTYEYHDNPSQLPLDNDAANIKLSGKCRIPTRKEWTELITRCKWTWMKYKGVYGYRVESINGSIFLPAAGACINDGLENAGSGGNYWSSSLASAIQRNAYMMCFNSEYHYMLRGYLFCGSSIRPVSE